MNWYLGSIQDAIATSKRRKAYFIVYVEGNDELSITMTKVLDSPEVSIKFETNNFVAIKLAKDSEGHKQFEAFYKLVPVPSLFFIDQNGSPVEIVVSDKSEEIVANKINNAIGKCTPKIESNASTSGMSIPLMDQPSTSASNFSSDFIAAEASDSSISVEPSTSSSDINSSLSSTLKISEESVQEKIPVEKPSGGNMEVTKNPSKTPPKTPSKTPPKTPPLKQHDDDVTVTKNASKTPPKTPSKTPPKTPPLKHHDDDVTVTKNATKTPPKTPSKTPPKTPPGKSENKASIEERVEKAKILIEKRKLEKTLEEMEIEKQAELERRRIGQEMLMAKLEQQERELRQLKEEREREKKEDALARQRILDQIAQDRAERAQRQSIIARAAEEDDLISPWRLPQLHVPPSTPHNITRLQFKLPSGETKSHSFTRDTTLAQVRQFIDNNIVIPFGGNYQLATSFPRREFTVRDNNRTLLELQLIPSAVILIIPTQGSLTIRAPFGWSQMLVDMFWELAAPVISLSRFLGNLVLGRRNGNNIQQRRASRSTSRNVSRNASRTNSNTRTGGRPSSATRGGAATTPAVKPAVAQRLGGTSSIKKQGNVYSLKENRDDDEDNNTWNGNSTQQM